MAVEVAKEDGARAVEDEYGKVQARMAVSWRIGGGWLGTRNGVEEEEEEEEEAVFISVVNAGGGEVAMQVLQCR